MRQWGSAQGNDELMKWGSGEGNVMRQHAKAIGQGDEVVARWGSNLK
jgi:hypothetical protein